MNGNNVLGLIFSNIHDEALSALTDARTMGSVPFGGRYRLIDFPLSDMVNCGITKVGVVTKSNYQSLMDHLGTGKPWGLSRKREGMFLLPPFNSGISHDSRLSALSSILDFIERSNEDYVVMSDCNVVASLDYEKLFEAHDATGADITIAYTHGQYPAKLDNMMVFQMEEDRHITEITLNPRTREEVDYSSNILLMRKLLLERLVRNAMSYNHQHFQKDLLMRNVNNLKIYGYEVEGFCQTIEDMTSYYKINMSLLNPENKKLLFRPDHPIFTKVRDDQPARYGLGSSVKNSLVADGCIIEGSVENCILFRGVTIAKGAVVKNAILMQGTYIGDEASVNFIISDKSVVIKPHTSLSGAGTYPIYIGKGSVV